MFKTKRIIKKKIKCNAILIGLPGIANVGKIAVDYIIETLKAKKILEIESSVFPNSVFVNDDNLVDLPKVALYYHKDKLFLTGDVQPLDEKDCYSFCEFVLNFLKEYQCKEIVTLGGIGLPKIPKKSKVYATGNSKRIVKKYGIKGVNEDIFGVVGPIVGVTGLLIGLASKKKINGACLLAQTYGHPNYLGIKGSRELLKVLNKSLKLELNLKKLDKEIKELEKETKEDLVELKEEEINFKSVPETRYIG